MLENEKYKGDALLALGLLALEAVVLKEYKKRRSL
mgnify:CR=1 FL=1